MKKIKLFLPVVFALVVICAMSLFACKKTGQGTLQSVEVTGEPYKTVFLLGEEFSSAGIEVTAKFSNSTKILTDEEYELDSSAYNANKEGTYEIKISYTYNGVTADTSYDVEVKETVYEGLYITIEGEAQDHILYLSQVIVKEVDKDGVVKEDALDSSEYTIKIYNGSTEFDYDGSEVVYLPNGTYQIWAFKDSSTVEGYILKNFAFITVS